MVVWGIAIFTKSSLSSSGPFNHTIRFVSNIPTHDRSLDGLINQVKTRIGPIVFTDLVSAVASRGYSMDIALFGSFP